jgi:DNA primase
MNFDRSLLPPAKAFYESEIGQLSRPDRRGWARGRCPFHQSKSGKSLSVHLSDGGWHCHGCGIGGGDVLAFVMKRDRVTFKRAAARLGAWKSEGLSESERRRIEREKLDRDKKRIEREKLEAANKIDRIAARDLLHVLEKLQRQTSEELSALEKQSPEAETKEKDFLFGDLCLLCDRIREAEQTYMKLSGLWQEETV